MPAAEADVLIRGAGPVGCALALALKGSNLRIKILEKKTPSAGFRPITLSYASRLILERIGVWGGLAATPIETVLVSQSGGFGRTCMQAGDAGVPALGYVLDYSVLASVLRSRVEGLVTTQEPRPLCTVHAEGVARDAEETRYSQDAVVALVRTEPASQAIAFERFTPEGPLALLPLEGRYAVVWSASPRRARDLAEAPESDFLAALAAAAGRRPGHPVAVEARAVQPLALRVSRACRKSCVAPGNPGPAARRRARPAPVPGRASGTRYRWKIAAPANR